MGGVMRVGGGRRWAAGGGGGFFFFKQKTAYEILIGLVGSEMCVRDSGTTGVSQPGRY